MGFLSESLQQEKIHNFSLTCVSHRQDAESSTMAMHLQIHQLEDSTQPLATAKLQCTSECGNLLDQVQSSFASGVFCTSVSSSIYEALNTFSSPISASVVQRGVLLVVLCL